MMSNLINRDYIEYRNILSAIYILKNKSISPKLIPVDNMNVIVFITTTTFSLRTACAFLLLAVQCGYKAVQVG